MKRQLRQWMELLLGLPFRVVTDISQPYPVRLLWSWLAGTESCQTGSQLHRCKFLHRWPTNLQVGVKTRDEIAASQVILKVCNTWIPYHFIFPFQTFSFDQITPFHLSPSTVAMSIWALELKKALYTYILYFSSLHTLHILKTLYTKVHR